LQQTFARFSIKMKTILFPIIILIPFAFLSRVTPVFADDECISCHSVISTKKIIHPAMEMGCSICHLSPHEKEEPELSLMSEVPDLCFMCHEPNTAGKLFKHSPAAAGMCTTCHNPHSSDNKKLWVMAPPALCYSCHEKKAFSKKNVHQPVTTGECIACHAPHASDIASILKKPLEPTCVKCHEKTSSGEHVLIRYDIGGIHPVGDKPDPSRKGRELSCVSCHNPHSSAMKLLFPNENRNTQDLCLMCHKKILVSPMR
jgi:predicted CXXCH cytochrome family protein